MAASTRLYNDVAERLVMQRPTIEDAHGSHIAGFDAAVEIVADAFKQDNPRFDRARFLKACGL